VWVALWEGGRVERYTPDGRLDCVVRLPVTLTTKCAFGGLDLRDLYITTASNRLDPDQRAAQPHAGGLFRIRLEIAGRPGSVFGG
jgi:sugar lactone lactonase YvrE